MHDEAEDTCGICLEPLDGAAWPAEEWTCRGCGKSLHAACAARWKKKTCPYCRLPMLEEMDLCGAVILALLISGAISSLLRA